MAPELSKSSADPADLTFQRFRAAIEGQGSYPRGAVFLDAEADFARTALVRNIRERRPVVLVFPDGEERIIQARSRPSVAMQIYAFARGRFGRS
jgi:hypothetical protein